MSGRASRVVLSSLLLLAVVLVPTILTAPGVRAGPPVVTLEATAKGTQTCSGATCSFGVVIASGGSTLLTMYLATGGGNNINVSAASCNAQPLTLLANFTTGTLGGIPTDFSHVYVFYGVGFAPGSMVCGGDIVGPGPGGTVVLWVDQVWSNVLQSTPIAQHAQATGTTETTMSVVLPQIPASTHVLADFVTTCCQLHVPTAGAGQTEQWAQFYAGVNYAKGSTKPGGSSATMSWTETGNDAWALYAIDIAAVPPIFVTFTFSTVGLIARFASTVSGGAGSPYNTTWSFGDGGTSYAANPSHTYAKDGTYTVFLNVTDAGSNTASASTRATILQGGGGGGGTQQQTTPIPVAVQYPQIITLQCNVVSLSDPRGDTAVASTVLWIYNFGDGSALDYSPVPTVDHTYATGGVYNATMTTQDKQGNVQEYSMSVDTTLAGCTGAVIRGLAPITFTGLFVALLVASFVAGKKHPKWKKRLRVGAIASLVIVIGVVVLL